MSSVKALSDLYIVAAAFLGVVILGLALFVGHSVSTRSAASGPARAAQPESFARQQRWCYDL